MEDVCCRIAKIKAKFMIRDWNIENYSICEVPHLDFYQSQILPSGLGDDTLPHKCLLPFLCSNWFIRSYACESPHLWLYSQRTASMSAACLAFHSGKLAGTASSHLSSGIVSCIDCLDINSVWEFFHRNLLSLVHRFIPSRLQLSYPSSHAWYTESCHETVALKQFSFSS